MGLKKKKKQADETIIILEREDEEKPKGERVIASVQAGRFRTKTVDVKYKKVKQPDKDKNYYELDL